MKLSFSAQSALLLLVCCGTEGSASVAESTTPFTITDDEFSTGNDTARLKVVKNTLTGEHFSVLVNAGGGVDELWLAPRPQNATTTTTLEPQQPFNSSLREVIWSHGRNASAVHANPTWKGRMLLPYANRIGGGVYRWNGTTYQLPINDVAGLNNSLHGQLWNRTMAVVATAADEFSANVTLSYEFNVPGKPSTNGEGYPFRLRSSITYTLTADGAFDVTVDAENVDIEGGWPLPYFNSWHPYFLCHPCSEAFIVLDQALLSTGGPSHSPSSKTSGGIRAAVDERGAATAAVSSWRHVDVFKGPEFPPPRYSNMVPTTHTSPWPMCNGSAPIGRSTDPSAPPGAPFYIDDEVKAMRAPVTTTSGGLGVYHTTLRDTGTRQTVQIHHDATMGYVQMFTGASVSTPNAVDAVALEPMSAMADAFNNFDGLHIISAGEKYTSRFGVRVLSGTE